MATSGYDEDRARVGAGAMELTAAQSRVLGALIEKQLATPDTSPLTLNALVAACNQTSNRDPVVSFTPQEVETTVLALKAKGLARVVHPAAGERATRYRQVLDEALTLTPEERAVLCVLLLRGPQTAAELKARTERLHPFGWPGEVEDVLEGLARRSPPLAVRLDRQPGRKEARWVQLLEPGAAERAANAPARSEGVTARGGRVDELEARMAALEARLASLEAELGLGGDA